MTRYSPARQYLSAGLVALALAAISAWFGVTWAPAYIPAFLLLASAAVVLYLAFRPSVEIHGSHLAIGDRSIEWSEIERVDWTGWISPMVVQLTLTHEERVLVIYPGDRDAVGNLLRDLRKNARNALIDGIPHREFWRNSEFLEEPERRNLRAPRYRVLTEEDEAEVERLYQQLKAAGHLEPKNSADEN
ncbi:MAG: DUF3093 family protein [Bryobacteraceae bacterium]